SRHTSSKRDWSSDVCSSDLRSSPRSTSTRSSASCGPPSCPGCCTGRCSPPPSPRSTPASSAAVCSCTSPIRWPTSRCAPASTCCPHCCARSTRSTGARARTAAPRRTSAGSTSSPAPSAPAPCSRRGRAPKRSSPPGSASPSASSPPPIATGSTEENMMSTHHALPSLSRRTFGAAALAGAGAAAALPTAAHAEGGPADDARIDEILAGMSIEQKIGQLFVAVGYGSTADTPHASNTTSTGVDTIAEIVRTHHVGGLIYFAWSENLESIEQIAALSNDVQEAALDAGGIPLVISTDEERGVVRRLPAPATPLPGQMALGATDSHAHARKAGDIVGTEIRAAGLHQAFSPVVDVNIEAQNPVIGVRSLGADPQAVSRLAAHQIRGIQGANCSAAAKHFPGHGDTATDSHLGLPTIDHTREQLDTLDLPP